MGRFRNIDALVPIARAAGAFRDSRDEVVMNRPTTKVVIVGGGTAGWITANAIAAEHPPESPSGVQVVLVESPDIPTIGVGEGTWPSMRMTLQRIGLSEDRMIRACNASFKQGTRFRGWSRRNGDDGYIHPFSLPTDYATDNPATSWLASKVSVPFAHSVTPQATLIEGGLAPKQATTPQYAFAFNYGYHLDAGAFADLLRQHAVEGLGVVHIEGNVERIEAGPSGDLAAVLLSTGERIDGELFVDCTGQRALLIGQHYGVGFTSATSIPRRTPTNRPPWRHSSATSPAHHPVLTSATSMSARSPSSRATGRPSGFETALPSAFRLASSSRSRPPRWR